MDEAELEAALEAAVRTIKRVVRVGRPGAISGERAAALVAHFAEAERAAASGIALFSPRVLESGSFAKAGFASAPDWLGAVAGSSAGVARGRLAAAERAARTPELCDALHDGRLSAAQLKIVAETAALDPEAPGALLSLVEEEASVQELSDAAARLRAAARSKETDRLRRARVHANRHFCWHRDPGGGIRGELFCDEVAWATVAPRLEAEAQARWKAAGSKAGESLEAHRLDAFLDLLGRSGAGRAAPGRPRAVVVVDAAALRRGTTQGDELCEIEGIGPVSVGAATELLSRAGLQFVLRDGVDITTVTGSSRTVAERIGAALAVRDHTCVVPGCGKRLGLQRDHWVTDYAQGGPTELANLARLCASHHDMKTHGGWRLGGGPGKWTWNPPKRPPSSGAIRRARRVATAKARRE